MLVVLALQLQRQEILHVQSIQEHGPHVLEEEVDLLVRDKRLLRGILVEVLDSDLVPEKPEFVPQIENALLLVLVALLARLHLELENVDLLLEGDQLPGAGEVILVAQKRVVGSRRPVLRALLVGVEAEQPQDVRRSLLLLRADVSERAELGRGSRGAVIVEAKITGLVLDHFISEVFRALPREVLVFRNDILLLFIRAKLVQIALIIF